LAVKNGSPLLVGIGEGKMFIASESAAFSRYTKEFIDLEDKEVAVLTAKGHSLDRSRIEHAPQEHIQISPAPWPHWTIKGAHHPPSLLSSFTSLTPSPTPPTQTHTPTPSYRDHGAARRDQQSAELRRSYSGRIQHHARWFGR
jgi:hypothetical protein